MCVYVCFCLCLCGLMVFGCCVWWHGWCRVVCLVFPFAVPHTACLHVHIWSAALRDTAADLSVLHVSQEVFFSQSFTEHVAACVVGAIVLRIPLFLGFTFSLEMSPHARGPAASTEDVAETVVAFGHGGPRVHFRQHCLHCDPHRRSFWLVWICF